MDGDSISTSVICPDTLLPAVCCDPDGSCVDGNDGWCCNDIFYCSNDSAEYAAEMGGILCPSTDEDDDADVAPCDVIEDCEGAEFFGCSCDDSFDCRGERYCGADKTC